MASKKTFLQLVAIAVAVVATFGYYATVTQIMGYEARYYYPSIAFCFLAAFTLFSSDAVANPTRSSHCAIGWRFLVGLVVLLPLLSVSLKNLATDLWKKQWIGTPVAIQSVTQYRTPKDSRLPSMDGEQSIHAMSDLLKRMPQGVVFAATEYGFLGSEFPDLTIIDLAGLHDRTIAHRGFSAAYVLSREPDLIWFPHWEYTHAVAQMRDNPAFVRDYDYFPEAYRHGIALRKSSDMYAAMKYEAEREFSRVYPGLRMSDYMAEPVAPPDKE